MEPSRIMQTTAVTRGGFATINEVNFIQVDFKKCEAVSTSGHFNWRKFFSIESLFLLWLLNEDCVM